ncbi:hypothetical protein Ade02nite_91830 [Paractinoplanes deccanensis]|uniref:Uncharacterized protein n=1 Tax=Paractinoplanes deccanensis TaxID=113561 RepID=A0ABQ3YKS2_9ACTN|nr:hypothetical protein [Actinoplanes deccanensis]GID80542.1 hypothetical protein Ade02nite_91830 [Actinoplanes deccanensis]
MESGDLDEHELLLMVLEICEKFFARAGQSTLHDVDALLIAYGITGGPGWLIDMLALSRVQLTRPGNP